MPTTGGDPTEHVVTAELLTPAAFAPFGDVLATEPHEAAVEVRDGETWLLNVLSYDHRPLVCDHLNAHRRATQTLVPLGSRPAVLVVAPAEATFADATDLDRVRAFVLDGRAAVNLALGTWHWGPYPVADRVDLLNLQGRGFADDNDVARLGEDLGVVVRVRV